MRVGFNENISYNGEVYHAQTEDGGLNNPVITTILFKGGAIIVSRRTSYADIIKTDRLDEIVTGLMKEQHRSVLNDLCSGAIQLKGSGGQ